MKGDEVRRLILGEEWVRAAPGGDEDALAHFSALAAEHVWNTFWVRDGLELRLRSVVTIAALVALDATDELEVHVAGALRARLLTPVEIREAILQLAPYLGYPRVRHAIARVNARLGPDRGQDP
jgi:alkylhydroperoxidase/carboxymuconolactone decarboxylase family protein YurZ